MTIPTDDSPPLMPVPSTPTIRPERPTDHHAIAACNTAAFDTDAEARLVDLLREAADPFISLVATIDGEVVGHIACSPATLDTDPAVRLMGLAPMAVVPTRQRQGIGAALVRAAIEACAAQGADAIIVLGHPEYYPRFGFIPASRLGIACQYEAPDEAFLCLELREGALRGKQGVAHYHDAFASL